MAKKKEKKLVLEDENLTTPVHIVTTETMPGYKIKEVKGFVWGSSVRARFLGKEIIASLRMVTGGEIVEYRDMLNEARFFVMQRLANNARKIKANAVVGARINVMQVVPGTIEVMAYGTAVKAVKK